MDNLSVRAPVSEDQINVECFYSYCRLLHRFARSYDIVNLDGLTTPSVVNTAYAKGGVGVRRGYFSPSPLFPLLSGTVAEANFKSNCQ